MASVLRHGLLLSVMVGLLWPVALPTTAEARRRAILRTGNKQARKVRLRFTRRHRRKRVVPTVGRRTVRKRRARTKRLFHARGKRRGLARSRQRTRHKPRSWNDAARNKSAFWKHVNRLARTRARDGARFGSAGRDARRRGMSQRRSSSQQRRLRNPRNDPRRRRLTQSRLTRLRRIEGPRLRVFRHGRGGLRRLWGMATGSPRHQTSPGPAPSAGNQQFRFGFSGF